MISIASVVSYGEKNHEASNFDASCAFTATHARGRYKENGVIVAGADDLGPCN
jgi:hypothetical protein